MFDWIITQAAVQSTQMQLQRSLMMLPLRICADLVLHKREQVHRLLTYKKTRRRSAIMHTTFLALIVLLLFVLKPESVRAQSMEVQISVISVSPPRVRIEGKRGVATRIWSFRNSYAGLLGLGDRIVDLTLEDASGINVPVRKLASGEYEASREAIRWRCEVNLAPPSLAADTVYVSWIMGEHGFLMLGDLLPRAVEEKSSSSTLTHVRLDLPATWNAFSSESRRSDGQFELTDTDDAVFFIGSKLRERRERVGQMEFGLVTEGTWAFSDQDVTTLAAGILKEYLTRTGARAVPRATLLLSHFPRPVGAERWSAETRGSTVTLLSGQSPSKIAGLAQLSTPLTHELFHIWVPNGLDLAGNYDWFYEGFTQYEALCVAVRLGFLTFQDYLNAVGRAYDAYSTSNEGHKLSLIEASLRRWTGPTTLVYQKGMLVAFLYDLSLRHVTQGKHSLDDVYRALFREPNTSGTKQEGNAVVLAILSTNDKLKDFVRSYIESAVEIDLKTMLAPFGLTVERAGLRTQILASDKLDRRQRDLLSAFGYNKEPRRAVRRVS